jgi:hypothetical protein
MLDLLSLVLNRDRNPVIDPLVGMTGKTNLRVPSETGADWTVRRDGKRLYVTIPEPGNWRCRRGRIQGRNCWT